MAKCTAQTGVHRTPQGRLDCPVHRGPVSPDALSRSMPADEVLDLSTRTILDWAAYYVDEEDGIAGSAISDEMADARAYGVATSSHTDPETLDRIARNANETIALGALSNPNCSPETLAWAAQNPSIGAYDASKIVAAHKNTDSETLLLLAQHPASAVRFNVASNPNRPLEAVKALLGDEKERVRTAATWGVIEHFTALGITPQNRAATATVMAMEWWDLTPDSPEIRLALEMSPNP